MPETNDLDGGTFLYTHIACRKIQDNGKSETLPLNGRIQ
jgi:hypothetical protein